MCIRDRIRIGQGFDVHQLVPQRPLIIGGVTDVYKRQINSEWATMKDISA